MIWNKNCSIFFAVLFKIPMKRKFCPIVYTRVSSFALLAWNTDPFECLLFNKSAM